MTVTQALAFPTARIITLLEMTAGIWFKNWTLDTSYPSSASYKVPCTLEITSVLWNRTTILTRADNPRIVDRTPGTWHWDGTYLWVQPPEDTSFFRPQTRRIALGTWFWWRDPSSVSIFSGAVQAIASFYFSTAAKTLNNRFYEPRVLGAPDLSQRIESRFGGIGQIGGGNLTLANADGYFDLMQDFQWDAGSVTMRIGVDTAAGDMAFADYQVMATWSPEEWHRSEKEFTLKLIEPKNRLKTELPFTFYDRATYPNIADGMVGKPIPIAYGRLYGLEPSPIDVGNKKFKIAGHAIREFSAVRIKSTREQKNSRVVAATDWQPYSGTTYRWYLTGEEARNVKFGAVSLTKQNSVADCVATAGSWCTEENFVYVNPSSGQTISSGSYTVESVLSVDSWQTTNFATVDPAKGEFTLGADWIIGGDVSIDILGKRDNAGNYLANGVDIISDLLATIGEANLNPASFAAARARLKLGTDESGGEVFMRVIGLYLTEVKAVEDTLADVMRALNGYLYTDASGKIAIAIFEPAAGENLPLIDNTDIVEFEEDTQKLNATKVIVHYNHRKQDDWEQTYTLESPALGSIHNQAQPVVFDDDKNILTEDEDVRSFAQRYLILDANQLKLYHVTIPWRGLLWKPGDQFRLQYAAKHLDVISELLEIKIDLGSKRCQLTLGNQRGFSDTPGFWVSDSLNCVSLDGSNDAIYFADNPIMSVALPAVTMEAWVYMRSGTFCGIMEKTVGGGYNTCAALFIFNNVVTFRLMNGGSNFDVTSAAVFPFNTWVHVAGVWDGTTMRIYFNGIADPATTAFAGPVDFGTGPAYLGTIGTGIWTIDGLIDEARFWNVAKSASELSASATLFLTGKEPGLLFSLSFDEASGTNAFEKVTFGFAQLQLGAFFTSSSAFSYLPARFSALAGFGSGSLAWNKNWHADIKTWARQNIGFWTDENGFADPTDADSKMTSTWI